MNQQTTWGHQIGIIVVIVLSQVPLWHTAKSDDVILEILNHRPQIKKKKVCYEKLVIPQNDLSTM